MKLSMKSLTLICVAAGTCAICAAADFSGNWVVAEPRGDGTSRRTYFNLKQQDGKITGTVRSTQFSYTIVDGRGTSERFIIFASMKDGDSERKRTYEGGLV